MTYVDRQPHAPRHIEDVEVLSVEVTRPEEKHLPAYDFTTLTALNTCPRWGAVRYLHGKTLYDTRRPMPLELGAACHNSFAAIRLYGVGYRQGLLGHMHHHGKHQFGGHWEGIADFFSDTSEDEQQRIRNGMMAAFHSSGFVDSQYDKRRTIANAEAALYTYLDQWEWPDVWIENANEPSKNIGVELLADFVIRLRIPPEYVQSFRIPVQCVQGDCLSIRYIGRMDGLHRHKSGHLVLHENKTSGRLDDAWEESFAVSHQITGYSVFASILADEHVSSADVIGLQIPLPRDTWRAVRTASVVRERHHYVAWAQWLMHTMEKVWLYNDAPMQAPMYTHSCNRYFRPCSMIPVCYAPPEEAQEAFDDMIDDPWSPMRDYESKTSGE